MKSLIFLMFSLFSTTAFCWQYATPIAVPITTTAATTIKAATGNSSQNLLTGIQMINTSVTPTIVTIQDGTTVIWTGYLSASQTVPTVVDFQRPLRAFGALNVVANTTGASIFVSAQGFEGR